MSIFGRGYPWNETNQQGLLDTDEIPSNMKLKNIHEYKNVLSRAHLKMILQDTASELSIIFSAILGVDLKDIVLFDNGQNLQKYINGKKLNQTEDGIKIFINVQDLRMYISLGKNAYLQPFSLATEAINHLRKAERESVFYCKFDETPIGRTMPIKDKIGVKLQANNWMYMFGSMMVDNGTNNNNNTIRHISGSSFNDIFYNSKDVLNDSALGWGYYITDRNGPKLGYDAGVSVPNVRVNEWRIPIYTTMCANATMFIENLDIQIDFMTNPFKHLDESNIDYIDGESEWVDTGTRYLTHISAVERGRNSDKIFFTSNTSSWAKKTQHTGAQLDFAEWKQDIRQSRYDLNKIQDFLFNKRPDRHLRYKVSAGVCFKEAQEICRLADFVEVNKVYDSEATIPMSSGMTYHYGANNTSAQNKIVVIPRSEGIYPDPEDLTNPMDLSIDFEFHQCASYPSSGGGLYQASHNYTLYDEQVSFLGYLIIRGYSGLVGSTLLNGSFKKDDIKLDGNRNVKTAYANATRPHDTFFKVTIRSLKNITQVGGSYIDPYYGNFNPSYDTGCGETGEIRLIPTAQIMKVSDDTELDSVKGGIYPELGCRHKTTTDYPFNYSDEKSYHVSKDLQWGTTEFYKYRIQDKGGFLRMPIRDYYWMYVMWNFNNAHSIINGKVNISGYIHPVTALLDYYYWSNKNGDNIGGMYMNGLQ